MPVKFMQVKLPSDMRPALKRTASALGVRNGTVLSAALAEFFRLSNADQRAAFSRLYAAPVGGSDAH